MGRVTETDPRDLYEPTARTRPSRNPQRAAYDRDAVHAALDSGFICHLGFVVDGSPVVLPHLYARLGETLYLHGSTGARAIRSAGPDGMPICVTATHIDALVFARSAFNHSINYRSIVMHGLARPVVDEVEKRAALDAFVNAATPGRADECRPANPRELAATQVLALSLAEVSLKVRTGPPGDEPEDFTLPYWAGLLPLRMAAREPIPADGVHSPVPAGIATWSQG
jgi:nitroimidazol reductase NimA-like FMN-containing flavoprotein (pyridoxamine 5'-phosphate oxidase superfamily)